jgi:hypothetical protein
MWQYSETGAPACATEAISFATREAAIGANSVAGG